MEKLFKISLLLLSAIFFFGETGMCFETIGKESVRKLLTEGPFIATNLSTNKEYTQKHFKENGTWLSVDATGNTVDFGVWRVNISGQICETSEFRIGKESCSNVIKEGDKHLLVREQTDNKGEKIIPEMASWQTKADYITSLREKALDSAPAAGER